MDIWIVTHDTEWEKTMVLRQLSGFERLPLSNMVRIHLVLNEYQRSNEYTVWVRNQLIPFIRQMRKYVKVYNIDDIVSKDLLLHKSGWHTQQYAKLLGPIKYGSYKTQIILDTKNIPISKNISKFTTPLMDLNSPELHMYNSALEYYKNMFDVDADYISKMVTPFKFNLEILKSLYEYFNRNDNDLLNSFHPEFITTPTEFGFYEVFRQKLADEKEKTKYVYDNYYKNNYKIPPFSWEYDQENENAEHAILVLNKSKCSWVTCRKYNEQIKFFKWLSYISHNII